MPANEHTAMHEEIAANDPTTLSLVSRALEGDDEEYRTLISGDAVRKQEVLLASMRDQARRRALEQEATMMAQSRREGDMRSEQIINDKKIMEESESGFRDKINR